MHNALGKADSSDTIRKQFQLNISTKTLQYLQLFLPIIASTSQKKNIHLQDSNIINLISSSPLKFGDLKAIHTPR